MAVMVVVVVVVVEEEEGGGQHLYKNHFVCYTDNRKRCIEKCIKIVLYRE
jgi:hypothetical protein